MRIILLGAALLLSPGCEKSQSGDRAAKLEQVRMAAEQHASPDDREAFATATPVFNLEDLPVPAIGLRVPLKGTSNAVFVMFTADHFDQHTVEQLSTEAIEDFTRAKNGAQSDD